MGSFDAIAVGGGLAGAAFALELARHGLKTAVIERTRGPHQKVCGDFHSREGQQLAASLGIDLARSGASQITTLRLTSGTRSATAPLPFTAAGLSRCSLDEALLEAARDAGAEVLRGESATRVEAGDDHVTVRLGARALRAKRIALATGKHNMRGCPRSRGALTAFKIQLDPAPAAKSLLAGVVQLVGYRGGYAGACMVENGVVSICWLADRDLMKETDGGWRRQLEWITGQSPLFGDLISGARFLADEPAAISAIPFGYMRRDAIADRVYPVGDQLAVIPSFTGDGTSLALASGLRAARAVLAGEGAGAYQRDHLARISSQFRWAGLAHLAFKSAPMRALSVGALSVVPHVASLTAELTRTRGVDDLIGRVPIPVRS
jgi:flavin-dependent dehydrogenase